MDIILQQQKRQQHVDCILQLGNGVKAGDAAMGISPLGRKTIAIGTGRVEDELFEENLRGGLNRALEIARAGECSILLIDVDSFASNGALSCYVENAIIDALVDWSCSQVKADLKIYLVSTLWTTDETLLQKTEATIWAPVKRTENLSFGDYEDPLKDEFETFLAEKAEQKSFREYLLELIEEKNYRKFSDFYKKAGVSKSTFSKITNFNLDYKPSKLTVAALAIGLELDLKTAQIFYHLAGYHLGTSDLSDRVIRFYIEKKIYDIREVNYCLAYYRLPLLGEHTREGNVRMEE